MPPARNRIFWTVFGTHAGILFLLLVIPLLRGCFREKPKEAIFVEVITESAPSAVVQPTPAPADPTPPDPTPAEQEPETPEIPDPEPPKTPDPVPQDPAPAPKPDRPKWEPKEVIPQNRRVTRPSPRPVQQTPPPKTISASDIKNAFSSAVSSSSANEHLAYCARLQPSFYAVWHQPSTAPYGTQAIATIRVNAAGTITYRALTHPSGNAAFDQSVRTAINAINRLPTPPSVSVNRDITVTFEIQ